MGTEEAIVEVMRKIDENPFLFNTESDIRSLLYKELLEEYPGKFDTSILSTGSPYKTYLVHTEYRYGKGKKKRLDTVIFDKQHVNEIKEVCLTIGISKSYHVPAKLKDAIEIKVDLGNRGPEQIKKDIDKDIDKLKELKTHNNCQNYYFIYICRWVVKKAVKVKQKEVRVNVNNARNRCSDEGIKFYTTLLPKSNWEQ